jgi:hypothetical protein
MYIKDTLTHLDEKIIAECLLENKGNEFASLDSLLRTNNGNNEYLISQTKGNLYFEENLFLKQEKLKQQLLIECGMEDLASPSKNLDDNELKQFDSIELEKYYIEKRARDAKSASNV